MTTAYSGVRVVQDGPTPWRHGVRIDVDFDHPFQIHDDGTVVDGPAGVFAPVVLNSAETDVDIEGNGLDGHTWEALTGFTGQHAYNGAVLHTSEYLGGYLAEHLLTHPAIYATCLVLDDTTDDNNPLGSFEPIGWCVLRLVGSEADHYQED